MPTATRIAERRAHPRAETDLPITIGAADRRFPARVRNLSRSGVCFTSSVPLGEMTALRVDLELPGSPIRADGAVVRCEKLGKDRYEVALFFTSMQEGDRVRLGRFVRETIAAS